MALELAFIKRVFETGYAPAQWKKDHLGWDLKREYELSLKNVHALPAVTPHAYRRIVSSLLGSTRDYHVGSGFFTTERASLPFLVKGTKGRFFIVRVDDSKVDPKTFPFRAGDELITFGGETAAEAVRRVRESLTFASVDTTDQRLAERILTERSAQSALDVPQGPIDVEVKREEGGKTVHIRRQLQWEYHPEQIEWNLSELKFHAMASSNQPKFNWLRP